MKGCNFRQKRAYSSVTLLMVAVSAMAAPGGPDSPSSPLPPPYREPSGYVPDTEFDPCLFSQAFTGCLNLQKALQKTKKALDEEKKTVSQFRALMNIKNQQSRLYIATLNELNAVRERLDECYATKRTVGSAFSSAFTPDDLNSSPVEISHLMGPLRQPPKILLRGSGTYMDYVSYIQTQLSENKSLRLCIAEKDCQLATGQRDVESHVAGSAEAKLRVKEN